MSPDLKTGMITCVRHSAGMLEWEKLSRKSFVESKCTVIRTLGPILSIPMALDVSSEHKASNTSDSEIPISDRVGVGDAGSCGGRIW